MASTAIATTTMNRQQRERIDEEYFRRSRRQAGLESIGHANHKHKQKHRRDNEPVMPTADLARTDYPLPPLPVVPMRADLPPRNGNLVARVPSKKKKTSSSNRIVSDSAAAQPAVSPYDYGEKPIFKTPQWAYVTTTDDPTLSDRHDSTAATRRLSEGMIINSRREDSHISSQGTTTGQEHDDNGIRRWKSTLQHPAPAPPKSRLPQTPTGKGDTQAYDPETTTATYSSPSTSHGGGAHHRGYRPARGPAFHPPATESISPRSKPKPTKSGRAPSPYPTTPTSTTYAVLPLTLPNSSLTPFSSEFPPEFLVPLDSEADSAENNTTSPDKARKSHKHHHKDGGAGTSKKTHHKTHHHTHHKHDNNDGDDSTKEKSPEKSTTKGISEKPAPRNPNPAMEELCRGRPRHRDTASSIGQNSGIESLTSKNGTKQKKRNAVLIAIGMFFCRKDGRMYGEKRPGSPPDE